MTLEQITEKIKNLEGNKIFWEKSLTDADATVVENAQKKIDLINYDIDNLRTLSFEMVIYPENFNEHPETEHPSMENIID